MPFRPLVEITLRAAAVLPPIVVGAPASWVMITPDPVTLPAAFVPLTSVPR
jgi:hypothetical protein